MSSNTMKIKPRLRLVVGQWYAFGGRGPKGMRNALLYHAIGLCRTLNARRKAASSTTRRKSP